MPGVILERSGFKEMVYKKKEYERELGKFSISIQWKRKIWIKEQEIETNVSGASQTQKDPPNLWFLLLFGCIYLLWGWNQMCVFVCVSLYYIKKMAHSDTRLHISRLLVVFSRGVWIYVWNVCCCQARTHPMNKHRIHKTHSAMQNGLGEIIFRLLLLYYYCCCCYIKFWHSFTSMYRVNILVYTLHAYVYKYTYTAHTHIYVLYRIVYA